MAPFLYTEAEIQEQCTPQVYERGLGYLQGGAVRRIERRGDLLLARVEGSAYPPYRVQIWLHKERITEARCSCPYDWGGWCKHIVAVLLTGLYQPERIAERASLEALLDKLDEDGLRHLVEDLAERYPRLIRRIERWVERNTER